MNDKARRKYEMLVRVRDFGATHAADFSASSKGGELFASVSALVTELEGHTEAQTSHDRAIAQGTAQRAAARDALRAAMEAIRRTARAMSLTTPGLDARFRIPSSANDQALISAARGFASAAEPLKAEFIRNELPANFLDTLQASIANFEQAITDQNTNAEGRVAATRAIDDGTERGSALVKQLDAVVRNKYADDAATVAAWESASRTERAPQAKKGKTNAGVEPSPDIN